MLAAPLMILVLREFVSPRQVRCGGTVARPARYPAVLSGAVANVV